MSKQRQGSSRKNAVTLRTIARHVGLAPCSISAVLNDSPAAQRIPQRTKNRVFRAVHKFNYRPNFSARALRTRRTHLLAVLVADLAGDGMALLISSIERELQELGYLLVLSTGGRGGEDVLSGAARVLRAGVEGIIAVGMKAPSGFGLPSITLLALAAPEQHGAVMDAADLGAKAARALVAQIEQESSGTVRLATAQSRRHQDFLESAAPDAA